MLLDRESERAARRTDPQGAGDAPSATTPNPPSPDSPEPAGAAPAIRADVERGEISAVAAERTVCSARVTRRSRRRLLGALRLTELVVDDFTADDAAILRDEGARGPALLGALLARAASQPAWRAHVITVVARASDAGVIGAAWRLAARLERGCEIEWAGADTIAVRIFGAGMKSRLDRALRHAPASDIARAARERAAARLAAARRGGGQGGLYLLDVERVDVAAAPPARIELREVPLADVARRPMLYADSVQGAEEPMARAERCFAGRDGDAVVFRMWVGAPRAEWVSDLPAGVRELPCWYVHDCRTIPSARRRGIYVAALHWLAALARAAGVRLLALHVVSDNIAAIRAVERAGFRPMRRDGSGRVERRGLALTRPGVLELVREITAAGSSIRVRAAGTSMWPTIPDGALVDLGPAPRRLRVGQVVLLDWNGTAVLHRIVGVTDRAVETCGDACTDRDPPTLRDMVVAVAGAVEHDGRVTTLTGSVGSGPGSWLRFARARARLAAARVWRGMRRRRR